MRSCSIPLSLLVAAFLAVAFIVGASAQGPALPSESEARATSVVDILKDIQGADSDERKKAACLTGDASYKKKKCPGMCTPTCVKCSDECKTLGAGLKDDCSKILNQRFPSC